SKSTQYPPAGAGSEAKQRRPSPGYRLGLGGLHDGRGPPRQDRVENGVVGLVDRGFGERDGVERVGLGLVCGAFGDLRIVRGLLRPDALSNALDVSIPIALDLVPLAFRLVDDLRRLGA